MQYCRRPSRQGHHSTLPVYELIFLSVAVTITARDVTAEYYIQAYIPVHNTIYMSTEPSYRIPFFSFALKEQNKCKLIFSKVTIEYFHTCTKFNVRTVQVGTQYATVDAMQYNICAVYRITLLHIVLSFFKLNRIYMHRPKVPN